jgi:outer membrane lipoprotein-sorting protein
MSFLSSRPAMRWAVPGAAAAAVLGGGIAIGTFATAAEPSLPPRTAAQLLVDLQTARLDGLSGTVAQRADLGLPDVAKLVGAGGSDLASLISGKNTLRVWYAGPDKARVALMGTLGETDVIRNGTDAWVWSSRTKEAKHVTVPAGSFGASGAAPSAVPGLPSTPQEAADMALAAIDPSTAVTVDRTARIAGRDAYQLVLQPRDTSSLVGRVTVAIDSTEHVPLRFQIFPKGSVDPAFEAAFTQISFARPDANQFAFNPPPGTRITDEAARPASDQPKIAKPEGDKSKIDKSKIGKGAAADGPKRVGTGWTTVLVSSAPTDATAPEQGQGEGAAQAQSLLNQLPKVSGAWGSGRLLSGKLFSVLLTDDGRVLGGLVSPERLYEVAAQK